MRAIKAILTRNITKFTRDKLRLFFTLLMAGFFLFIFSFVMKSVPHMIDQPMNYLISGIIIMTVFQTALNNSLNILEDISSGFMKEILVAPISRWQIAIN
jgi:ABC-2 type transport system permease protein